ncbi:protein of unknown function (DUF928) [Synechococcus sp. PCC 7502]|uniref:DUF928 domain-containing protein n=1 Tax=Synechococcus sp. PCC 7502 TaxID=1173263 RepID=UPI00029F878E|nr:DUF928 domain-containing protein [Synechococcus sp. PCC 7502]AFY72920.1 protein of unknown function (DUF928) [Synechococcus sp. PCC 7502]
MNNLSKTKQILATSVLSVFLSLSGVAISAPTQKPYGLGIPISSGTGGAVRSINTSLVIPLVPDDGGRTASERPTFYWYLADSANFPYKTIFELKDPTDRDGNVLFKVEGIAEKSGLYKLTLPKNAPALKPDKLYVWQLRMRGSTASSNLQTVGSILLSRLDGDMQKAIAKATTNIEKAQLYSQYGYWFDALSIYTNQLETEPKNQDIYKLRSEMILQVFTPQDKDPQLMSNLKSFIDKVNSTPKAELLSAI